MPTVAAIILIATIALFAGLAVWLAVTGRNPILPKGQREYEWVEVDRYGSTVCIVRWVGVADILPVTTISRRIARAIRETAVVWGESGYAGMTLAKANEIVGTVRVLIMSDGEFNAYAKKCGVIGIANGFQIWTPQRVGSGPLLLVLRGSLPLASLEALAVHETCHGLAQKAGLGGQHRHDDERVWIGSGGADSLEGVAVLKRSAA